MIIWFQIVKECTVEIELIHCLFFFLINCLAKVFVTSLWWTDIYQFYVIRITQLTNSSMSELNLNYNSAKNICEALTLCHKVYY